MNLTDLQIRTLGLEPPIDLLIRIPEPTTQTGLLKRTIEPMNLTGLKKPTL